MVTERNWLEVYPYANWGSAQQLPHVQQGHTFMPSALLLKDVCLWFHFSAKPLTGLNH